MSATSASQAAESRPADVINAEGEADRFRAALWTDERLVLVIPPHRIKPDGSVELSPEETMLVAKLTSSLIFI